MTEHEVIYLQPECACNGSEGRLWCQDDQGPCEDCRKPWLRYVRVGIGSAYDTLPSDSEPANELILNDAGPVGDAGSVE